MILTDGIHPNASFWLDLADRIMKFLALLVGSAWTWMHYRRSRTYAQKLELQVDGSVFFKGALYVETTLGIKNLGAARHPVRHEGTSCTLWAIGKDLSELRIYTFDVFERDEWIEPGESIHDSKQYFVDLPSENIIWLKIEVRVISKLAEWNAVRLVRIEPNISAAR